MCVWCVCVCFGGVCVWVCVGVWVCVCVQSLNCVHVQLFETPWTEAHQASLSFIIFQSLLRLMSIESAMPSNHLILCCPLLLLPSIFPSIRDFSNESALHIRWLKYWSFSFSISPSNEYPRLISFRIDYIPHKPVRSQISHITSQMLFPLKAKFQLGNNFILKTKAQYSRILGLNRESEEHIFSENLN